MWIRIQHDISTPDRESLTYVNLDRVPTAWVQQVPAGTSIPAGWYVDFGPDTPNLGPYATKDEAQYVIDSLISPFYIDIPS